MLAVPRILNLSARILIWAAAVATLEAGLVSAGDRAGESGAATMYDLTSVRQVGEVARVVAELQVGGDLKLSTQGNVQKIPMSVVATLAYDEKLLQNGAGPKDPLRSIRHYEKAEAVLKVDNRGIQPALGNDRRVLIVHTAEGRTTIFSPIGPLTRDELDLVNILGNSLVLDRLVPGRKVAIGESWKQPTETICALMGLDAVAQCDVESVLTGVENGVARFRTTGKVHGAAEGVATEIELKANVLFNLKDRRVTDLSLAIQENRSIGHVGPGLDLVAKLNVKVRAIPASEHLADRLIEGVPTEPQPELTRLFLESRSGGFRFTSDRRWYVTSDEPKLVVLRLVDRGDLVAQCNISPIVTRSPEARPSLTQYQVDVRHALGQNFGRFIAASESTDKQGQLIYRAVAQGEVEKLPIEWRYYLITHPSGHRVALVFAVETELAERFGDLDRELVATLELVPPEVADAKPAAGTASGQPAGQPTPAKTATRPKTGS